MKKIILALFLLLSVSAVAGDEYHAAIPCRRPVADVVRFAVASIAKHGGHITEGSIELGSVTGSIPNGDGHVLRSTLIHFAASTDTLYVTAYLTWLSSGANITREPEPGTVQPIIDEVTEYATSTTASANGR